MPKGNPEGYEQAPEFEYMKTPEIPNQYVGDYNKEMNRQYQGIAGSELPGIRKERK